MARHGENIRKRSDGRWEARVLMTEIAGNVSRYHYLYGATYEEARKKKTALLNGTLHKPAAAESPIPLVSAAPVTFAELAGYWLRDSRTRIKNSTFAKYRFNLQRHILPYLGDYAAEDVTAFVIKQFAAQMRESGSLTKNKGLSPKTVNCLLSIIKLVLMFGRQNELTQTPAVEIHTEREILPQIHVLSKTDQLQLQKYLLENPNRIHLGILISIWTGLRIGEVCGLTWRDISPQEKTLRVERTVFRMQNTDADSGPKTILCVESPKTENSRRTVPLPNDLMGLLEQYRENPDCYVLTGTTKCMEPRNYYRQYKKILRACGLPSYNYHALRHTFATRCMESGCDVKALSEMLGHADVNVTLRRYVHPSMETKRKYINKLAESSLNSQIRGQKISETA